MMMYVITKLTREPDDGINNQVQLYVDEHGHYRFIRTSDLMSSTFVQADEFTHDTLPENPT